MSPPVIHTSTYKINEVWRTYQSWQRSWTRAKCHGKGTNQGICRMKEKKKRIYQSKANVPWVWEFLPPFHRSIRAASCSCRSWRDFQPMNQRNGRNSYKNVNQKNDKSATEDDVGRNIVVVAFLLFDHIELGHERALGHQNVQVLQWRSIRRCSIRIPSTDSGGWPGSRRRWQRKSQGRVACRMCTNH